MLFKDFLKRSTFFVIKNKTYRSNIYFGTESKKNSQRSFDRDPLQQLRKKMNEAKKEENFNNYTSTFFAFLKRKDNENQQFKNIQEIDYYYSDNIIFENKLNKSAMKTSLNTFIIQSGAWGALGYLAYSNIHPVASLIPFSLLFGSLLQYKVSSNYMNALCYKMKLLTDKQHVSLYMVTGNREIICKIEDLELVDVLTVDSSYRSLKIKEDKEHPAESEFQSFVVTINASDVTKNQFKGIKLLMEPTMSEIENIDLLRSILNGENLEVAKFKFQNEVDQEVEEDVKPKQVERL